jgi:hypothetical protein
VSDELPHVGTPAPKPPKRVRRKKKPPPPPPKPKPKFVCEVDGVLCRTIVLWDDRWGVDELEAARADMGQREFDRGFRQMAISEGDLAFQPGAIAKCLDSTFTMVPSMEEGSHWLDTPRYAGVDLAIADIEQEGSYFVCTVIAVDRAKQCWVLWVERHRGLTFNQQLTVLADVHKRFNIRLFKVESNYYQKAIVQSGQEKNLPVEGYVTTAVTKKDLQIGVPSMGAEFEQGRWHLPQGDARSIRMLEPLLDELHVFPLPGYKDDCVMSLFFARECVSTAGVPRMSVMGINV